MIISKVSKMGKNVLVISSSLRVTSNSAVLAHEIVRGATDAGNNAEFLSLAEKDPRIRAYHQTESPRKRPGSLLFQGMARGS